MSDRPPHIADHDGDGARERFLEGIAEFGVETPAAVKLMLSAGTRARRFVVNGSPKPAD